MRLLTTALLIALLGSSTGCYLNSAGKELERRVATIEARQNEFQSTFEAERTRLTELLHRAESQVAELQTALDEAQTFLTRNHANLGARLDQLEQQIAELRGRLEEAQHAAGVVREELQLFREEMNIRLEEAQGGGM